MDLCLALKLGFDAGMTWTTKTNMLDNTQRRINVELSHGSLERQADFILSDGLVWSGFDTQHGSAVNAKLKIFPLEICPVHIFCSWGIDECDTYFSHMRQVPPFLFVINYGLGFIVSLCAPLESKATSSRRFNPGSLNYQL